MQITDLLAQTGAFDALARDLGIPTEQASRGAEALLPALLKGLQQGGASTAGLGGLSGLLEQVLSPQPTDPSAGNEVLGQIFGSKDVSRSVAQGAAEQTGLDAGLLRKMLPLLAMAAAGWMARQQPADGGGGLGAALGGLLNQPGVGDVLGGLLGGRR